MAYPATPGYQDTDTSKAAAHSISDKAAVIKKKVYDKLCEYPFGETADKIAVEVGETIHNVRSRMTELQGQALVSDSGRRGKSAFGKSQIIWLASGRKYAS